MKKWIKEMLEKTWVKRSIRTFVQAFFGTLSMQFVAVTSNMTDDTTLGKAVILSTIASAFASGVAAVMNLDEK